MRTLFVAISGGHLAQLKMLQPRLVSGDATWVTNRTSQSESLLAGETVFHVPTRPPRDWLGVLRDSKQLQSIIAKHEVSCVVSTGSQVALSAYMAAKFRRIPFAYVESATRVTKLSATGNILDKLPGVYRYVQHEENVNARWSHKLSVFDGFSVTKNPSLNSAPRRIVVTLGGNGEYGFPRLLEAVDAILPSDSEVLWQLGSTTHSNLPGRVVDTLPSGELENELRAADAVIGHAGTGTALAALLAGKLPILVPRSSNLAEHVDGHQEDLAAALGKRGLAIIARPDELSWEMIALAAGHQVERREFNSRIDLFGTLS